jgi:hypothetical protein
LRQLDSVGILIFAWLRVAERRAGKKAGPYAERWRKMKGEVTFADDVVVTFPEGDKR